MESRGWQVGVAMAVVASWGVLNTLRVRYQGLMSNFSTLFQVVSTLAIVLAVLAVPESGVRNSWQTVWFSTRNDTGLSASYFPYVAVMGLLSSTFALAGYESAAHVAEETTRASTVGIGHTESSRSAVSAVISPAQSHESERAACLSGVCIWCITECAVGDREHLCKCVGDGLYIPAWPAIRHPRHGFGCRQ